jgi:hypothetical protein
METFDHRGRVLSLAAAAKRLNIPERTLRHRASRGRIPGAFKRGKLWKFSLAALVGPAAGGPAGGPPHSPIAFP